MICNKFTAEEMYIFSYYAYLDLVYESILEKDGLISKEKFEKFLNIPGIFSDTFYNFLNDKERLKERKESFLGYCFIFFNPYIIKDEIFWAGMMYNIFRSRKENLLFLKEFIYIIDNILINFFMKSKENNFEFIYSSLIRINMMIKIELKNEQFLTFDRFTNLVNNNVEFIEVIQFIFFSVSPLYRKVINNIKESLLENDYDNIDSPIRLKIKKKFLQLVFEKIENNEDSDFNILMEENDGDNDIVNNPLIYNISELIRTKDKNKSKKLEALSKQSRISFEMALNYDDKKFYKREYEISNLFKIKNCYSGYLNENNISSFKVPTKTLSSNLNRSFISENCTNLELEYFFLGDKKVNTPRLSYINDFNGNQENNILHVFSHKFTFEKINAYKIDNILMANYDKICEKYNNNQNEVSCFYIKDKSFLIKSDLDSRESRYFYKLKIIDGNIIFFKKDIYSNKLIFNRIIYENCYTISKLEFNNDLNDSIIITLKDSGEDYHSFIFNDIRAYDKFIYLLIINKQLSYKEEDNVINRIFRENLYLKEFQDKEKIEKSFFEVNKDFLKSNFLKEIYYQINKVFDIINLIKVKEIKGFFDSLIILSNKFKIS